LRPARRGAGGSRRFAGKPLLNGVAPVPNVRCVHFSASEHHDN
jgi:hypothetical protein